MFVTILRLAIASALVLTLVACPAVPSASVISVTIDVGDQSLVVGATLKLTATVVISGSGSDTVTWGSSDEIVATVGPDGTLSALAVGTTKVTATSVADPSKSDSITVSVALPGALGWTRQFGTSSDDFASGIVTDATGNTYAAGYTAGALEGSNAGSYDALIRSYDSDGNHRWTRQFGTSSSDVAWGLAADAHGNTYAAGYTAGALEGSNAGSGDPYIRSYDSDGSLRWTRQFGTSSDDVAFAIATDTNGNTYAAGYTAGALEGSNAGGFDAFIRSYDSDGSLRWTRQFGTSSNDVAQAIASDANGNTYAAGYTVGALEGSNAGSFDAFIRSYDSDGNIRWTRQFGTSSDDYALAIATDADGNTYAAGYTAGALEGSNAGLNDAFIRSYDSDGNIRWTRQFGTSSGEIANGIATDANGNTHAAGYTYGALEGANAGNTDAFIRSYDSDGNIRWTRQFGTSSDDYALAIATDADGNSYAAGYTYGALIGTNAGGQDGFMRKYGP